MIGSLLTYERRHVVGFTALMIALGGSAYAVARPAASPVIRICVQPGTGALHAAGSGGKCPNGELSFLVGGSGIRGPRGFRGPTGPRGPRGLTGATGVAGPNSDTGPKGDQGVPGPIVPSQYGEFYALMPPDLSRGVFGAGARSGAARADSGFRRGAVALPYTVYGRATGTTQIAGEALVSTTAVNSVISVGNPAGNSNALTIAPLAGGTHADAASLTIEQLS